MIKKLKSPFKIEKAEPPQFKKHEEVQSKSKRKFDLLNSLEEFDSNPSNFLFISINIMD
jgi:hypothetical protein